MITVLPNTNLHILCCISIYIFAFNLFGQELQKICTGNITQALQEQYKFSAKATQHFKLFLQDSLHELHIPYQITSDAGMHLQEHEQEFLRGFHKGINSMQADEMTTIKTNLKGRIFWFQELIRAYNSGSANIDRSILYIPKTPFFDALFRRIRKDFPEWHISQHCRSVCQTEYHVPITPSSLDEFFIYLTLVKDGTIAEEYQEPESEPSDKDWFPFIASNEQVQQTRKKIQANIPKNLDPYAAGFYIGQLYIPWNISTLLLRLQFLFLRYTCRERRSCFRRNYAVNGVQLTHVETQRLSQFINKYGIQPTEGKLHFSSLESVEDFIAAFAQYEEPGQTDDEKSPKAKYYFPQLSLPNFEPDSDIMKACKSCFWYL